MATGLLRCQLLNVTHLCCQTSLSQFSMDCPTNQLPFSCDKTRKQRRLPLNSTEDKAISVNTTVAAVLSELGGILRLKGEQRMALKAFLLFVDNMFSPYSDCLRQVMLNSAVHHSSERNNRVRLMSPITPVGSLKLLLPG